MYSVVSICALYLLSLHKAHSLLCNGVYTSHIILLVDCSVTALLLSSSLSLFLSLPSRPLLPPSLPRSVHPSTHLAEVRSGRPRRVEWSEGWSDSWSPVRQGETNYPSNESHSSSLHLSLLSPLSSSTPRHEIQRTWMATKKTKLSGNKTHRSTAQLYI